MILNNTMKQILVLCAVIFGSIASGYFFVRILGFVDNLVVYIIAGMDMSSVISVLLGLSMLCILFVLFVVVVIVVSTEIASSAFDEIVLTGMVSGIVLRYLITLVSSSLVEGLILIVGVYVVVFVCLLLIAIVRYLRIID